MAIVNLNIDEISTTLRMDETSTKIFAHALQGETNFHKIIETAIKLGGKVVKIEITILR